MTWAVAVATQVSDAGERGVEPARRRRRSARTPALHHRRVASVGLHGASKKLCVSVTRELIGLAEISILGLAPPVRPSNSSGVPQTRVDGRSNYFWICTPTSTPDFGPRARRAEK